MHRTINTNTTPRSARTFLRAARAMGVLLAGAAPAFAAVPLFIAAAPVAAQDEAADRSPDELLGNFIHFIKIARYDVAASEGRALLDSGLSAAEFVDLVDGSGELDRFRSSVARGLRVEAVQEIAAALEGLYRTGRLERARDPQEVERNIGLLTGNMGERLHARERLLAAGEYAVKQLLDALLSGAEPALRARVQQVLIELGRNTVIPLSEALPSVDPVNQERILNVLAAIPYRASLPAVVRVYNTAESQSVRQAAARVVTALGGNTSDSAANLYTDLAEAYYDHRDELTSFPGEDFQLMWSFGTELSMDAVPTEVYHESMAMRMAERSLRLNADSPETLALWIASAFRREVESTGVEHVREAADREAMYYAVAAGPSIGQRILARALSDRDTPLARRAIAAIERTAGTETLTSSVVGSRPLINALSFHSRRVQIEAALALALSQPETTFDGAERVVPILASAIRDAGERYAVVLTGTDREEYDRVRTVLVADGFTVLPPADNGVRDILGPIAEAPGIDLIVASQPGAASIEAHDEARAEPRLSAAPMLVLARSADSLDLQRRFDRDPTVMVRRDVINDDQLTAAIGVLVERAIGGVIDDTEARDYTARSLSALRDLAVARNQVLSVEDAALAMIAALEDAEARVAPEIAEVLAHIAQARAQTALMDAALDAGDAEQAELLSKVADSAKRFGNMLEPRQVTRLLSLASSDDDGVATAAAAVMGALDLPNTDLVPLITGDAGTSSATDRASR